MTNAFVVKGAGRTGTLRGWVNNAAAFRDSDIRSTSAPEVLALAAV